MFRDNGEEEFVQNEYIPGALSARRLDISTIQRMVSDDKINPSPPLSSRKHTPGRKSVGRRESFGRPIAYGS